MRYLLAAGLLGAGLSPRSGPPTSPRKTPPKAATTYEVPYRLTDTKHVLVRVKINGKGPFNFILDTGAPALFMTEAVAKKAGGKADERAGPRSTSSRSRAGCQIDEAARAWPSTCSSSRA